MRIGIARETKEGERRVALRPDDVQQLTSEGHEVRVARGAGDGADANDAAYEHAGARVTNDAEAWASELVVKVKEVQPGELAWARPDTAIFGFQHLVGEPAAARALAARGSSAIAFERVRDAQGGFPLLSPMSRMAGRIAVREAVRLLGRIPRDVLVLGAGHAGLAAARAVQALGSRVTVLSRSQVSCDRAATQLDTGARTALATAEAIEHHSLAADLVVGAVFAPGEPTPKLLARALVARMRPGAMIADLSIDAGGVAETSRATTHAEPTFVAEGVIHYCVPNIPALDPRGASAAIAEALLPYVRDIARLGLIPALVGDAGLREAVVLWRGAVCDVAIAAEACLPYTPISDCLA